MDSFSGTPGLLHTLSFIYDLMLSLLQNSTSCLYKGLVLLLLTTILVLVIIPYLTEIPDQSYSDKTVSKGSACLFLMTGG